MTRKKAIKLLPAIKHFACGGNLWAWDYPFSRWIKQTTVYTNDTYPIQNILEDKHFKARKADALQNQIQGKQQGTQLWATMMTQDGVSDIAWLDNWEYRQKPEA